MDRDKVITRIAALLALAKNAGATEAEAKSARARADDIAHRYGIDVTTVKPGGVVSAAPIHVTHSTTNGALWRASLGWAIARYTGIEMVRLHGGKAWGLVGRKEDIEVWGQLYNRAEPEIDREGAAHATRFHSRSEGDTFRKGAAAGFGERLREYRLEAERSEEGQRTIAALGTPTTGTELVLVGRALAVSAKKKEVYPRTSNIAISTGGTRSSFADGRAFGRSMGVHRGNLKGGQ